MSGRGGEECQNYLHAYEGYLNDLRQPHVSERPPLLHRPQDPSFTSGLQGDTTLHGQRQSLESQSYRYAPSHNQSRHVLPAAGQSAGMNTHGQRPSPVMQYQQMDTGHAQSGGGEHPSLRSQRSALLQQQQVTHQNQASGRYSQHSAANSAREPQHTQPMSGYQQNQASERYAQPQPPLTNIARELQRTQQLTGYGQNQASGRGMQPPAENAARGLQHTQTMTGYQQHQASGRYTQPSSTNIARELQRTQQLTGYGQNQASGRGMLPPAENAARGLQHTQPMSGYQQNQASGRYTQPQPPLTNIARELQRTQQLTGYEQNHVSGREAQLPTENMTRVLHQNQLTGANGRYTQPPLANVVREPQQTHQQRQTSGLYSQPGSMPTNLHVNVERQQMSSNLSYRQTAPKTASQQSELLSLLSAIRTRQSAPTVQQPSTPSRIQSAHQSTANRTSSTGPQQHSCSRGQPDGFQSAGALTVHQPPAPSVLQSDRLHAARGFVESRVSDPTMRSRSVVMQGQRSANIGSMVMQSQHSYNPPREQSIIVSRTSSAHSGRSGLAAGSVSSDVNMSGVPAKSSTQCEIPRDASSRMKIVSLSGHGKAGGNRKRDELSESPGDTLRPKKKMKNIELHSEIKKTDENSKVAETAACARQPQKAEESKAPKFVGKTKPSTGVKRDPHSIESLRNDLIRKRTPAKSVQSAGTSQLGCKRIQFPANFEPSQMYRATAAYSLLRTLSIELRLSPFTLEAFLHGLMLPVPCNLMGEIHARVLKVLFANINYGSYSKFGEEPTAFIRKESLLVDGAEYSVETEVPKKGGDNLSNMDGTTWPLFFQDYVVAVEEKFAADSNPGGRDEQFVCSRSIGMSKKEMNPSRQPDFGADPTAQPEFINRCPAGPFGERNSRGRFVCCSFHISTALDMFCKQYPNETSIPAFKKQNGNNKRARPPKKSTGRDRKTRRRSADATSSESDYSDDSDEDYDGGSVGGGGVRDQAVSDPQRHQESQTSVQCPLAALFPSFRHIIIRPGKLGIRIRVEEVRSINVGAVIAEILDHCPFKEDIVVGDRIVTIDGKRVLSVNCFGQALGRQRVFGVVPSSVSAHLVYKCVVLSLRGTLGNNTAIVKPVQLPPVSENALAVSDEIETSISSYLSGNPGAAQGRGVEDANADGDGSECFELEGYFDGFPKPDDSAALPHLEPIKQLEKGIPYHHLSLDSKLTMLEFLLDELLQCGEIANEMTRRFDRAAGVSCPYGDLPTSAQFENLCNKDECTICNLEGDLLCCDGCTGSFHRACIGMPTSAALPEGKWLCPECTIRDLSQMAPLGSSQRPMLSWLTIGDLAGELRLNLWELEPETYSRPRPREPQSVEATHGQFVQTPTVPNQLILSPTAPNQLILSPTIPNPLILSPTSGDPFSGSLNDKAAPIGTNDMSSPTASSPSMVNLAQNVISEALPARSEVRSSDEVSDHPVQVMPSTDAPSNPRTEADCLKPMWKVIKDVEFLVAGDVVFARYRSTKQPFDPYDMQEESSAKVEMEHPLPPLPLTPSQVRKVLEILGPKVCSVLPWLRVPFDTTAVFIPDEIKATKGELVTLENYQKEERKRRQCLGVAGDPLSYASKYRTAPPTPLLNAHQGPFQLSLLPDAVVDISVNSSLSLTTTSLDASIERSQGVSVLYQDPMRRLKSKMSALERLLFHSSLLDCKWNVSGGTICHVLWQNKVDKAKSVFKLNRLLVELADACSPRAFVHSWHENSPKEKDRGGRRSLPSASENRERMITDNWSARFERDKRRWERCSLSTVLKEMHGELSLVFQRNASKSKRGKRIHTADDTTPGAKRSAYTFFTLEMRPKLAKQFPNISISMMAKLLSEKWRTISPEEKAKYASLASDQDEEDKAVEGPVEVTVKRKANAFNLFTAEKIPKLKATYPNANLGHLAKLIGELWQLITAEEKKRFVDMADKERQNIGAVQDEESVPAENTNVPKDCRTVTLIDNDHVDDEFTCSKEASKCTDSTPGVDELANTTSSLVRDAQEQVALNSSKPNGAPATVKKPTKKRKARGSLPATSSKRRSDRTNLHRKQVESLFQVSTSKLDDQEREIFELKLDKLEKILATEIPSAQYFTIAGGKLFEPAGRISRRSVKHLGRNAGSCKLPALSYESTFEVGETSTCHHWRKRTLESKTYEGLALSLRLLDNYIDKAILTSASSLARKFAKKGGTELAVRCAQRDSETGIFEYFVVTGTKRKGQWNSEIDIDLPSLIQYRVHRQRPYIRPPKTSQTKHKPPPLANKPVIRTQNTTRSEIKAVPKAKAKPPKSDIKAAADAQIKAAVEAHTAETLAQLKISASRGQKCVPGHVMDGLRNRTTLKLKEVRSLGTAMISKKLSLAEEIAVSQYIAFIKR